MTTLENRTHHMIHRLKDRGFRMTPQRLAVVKILASSEEHLSADQIYARVRQEFPCTSLATIYKIVTLLKSVGEVMEMGFVDDSNRYDGARPYPHPHLICTKCKKIIDPDLPTLAELPRQLGQKTGYHIIEHRLDFFGICPECREMHQIEIQ